MKNNWRGFLPFAGLAVLVGLVCAPSVWAQDIAIGHFQGADYADWAATGTAFRLGPAKGDMLTKLEIENSSAGSVASSEIEGDGPKGTLTSPEFVIQRKAIAFRIGGGNYERHTCLNLLVGGKMVKSATGWRSDRLAATSWDVSQFVGQKAQVQLVDEASGDWGHINVDQIVQTDHPERPPMTAEPLYQEALRPQFHFTARQWTMDRLNPREREEGWLNDLNGLIYYDGEYHLFAQRWNKCWVHAVSRDLIHWTELEPAFWEEELDSAVQSGTCVIDYNNTSGLGTDKKNPPMVAFWSRNDNQSQCLSYSLDHGRTWTHYAKNPVMVFPERDPKVFWYAPSNHWVMMMYGREQYHIFSSTNLLNWKDEHNPVPNSYECPDFFEMSVNGDRANRKWVLIQGDGKYSIGKFNGKKFTPETERFTSDTGDFYATQSWHNTETGDGRRIQAAWMRFSHFPDMPFSQEVTFPCELTLTNTAKGLRVYRQPIAEISRLHQAPDVWTNHVVRREQTLLLEPAGQLFHIKAELEMPEDARLIFKIRGVPLVVTSKTIQSGARSATVEGAVHTVEILVDRTSIEAFVNHGEVSSTRFVLPKENGLSVKAEDGSVTLKSLTIYPLNSAWTNTSAVKW